MALVKTFDSGFATFVSKREALNHRKYINRAVDVIPMQSRAGRLPCVEAFQNALFKKTYELMLY